MLEQLAIKYLESKGALLDTASAPIRDVSTKSADDDLQDLKKQFELMQEESKNSGDHFEALIDELFSRLEKVEEKVATNTP